MTLHPRAAKCWSCQNGGKRWWGGLGWGCWSGVEKCERTASETTHRNGLMSVSVQRPHGRSPHVRHTLATKPAEVRCLAGQAVLREGSCCHNADGNDAGGAHVLRLHVWDVRDLAARWAPRAVEAAADEKTTRSSSGSCSKRARSSHDRTAHTFLRTRCPTHPPTLRCIVHAATVHRSHSCPTPCLAAPHSGSSSSSGCSASTCGCCC